MSSVSSVVSESPDLGLTQRRRESQRFAESSSSLRFSAFLCVSALSPVPQSKIRGPNRYPQPVASDFLGP